jgi:signal transduction histidine kinase
MDYVSKYLSDDNATGLLLKFSDENIESDFWEQRYASRKGFIEITILITILAIFASSARFMPYVSEVLPTKSIYWDFLVRLFLLLPLIVAFIISKIGSSYKTIQVIFIFSAVLCGLSFSSLMLLADIDGIIYYNYSFIHVMIYVYVLLLIPIRKSFPVVFFLCSYHVFLSYLVIDSLPTKQILFIISPCVTIFMILSYAGYSIEKSERFSFMYRRALGNEHDNRISIQEQRSKWLGMVTDFLRHELKNSLIGISSSLELINRKNKNEDLDRYIQRAGNSTGFMRRLLDEASTSTSLEAALNDIHLEEFNLSRLLEEKVYEYRDVYGGYSFDTDIEKKVCASFDADRLAQALDKLINNAVEHCDTEHPITVSLKRKKNNAHMTVSNIGDPIKDGVDIFQPFVSDKSNISNDNFGLGLFVVKRIVEAHGGEVSAKGLRKPDGAVFTISLPL